MNSADELALSGHYLTSALPLSVWQTIPLNALRGSLVRLGNDLLLSASNRESAEKWLSELWDCPLQYQGLSSYAAAIERPVDEVADSSEWQTARALIALIRLLSVRERAACGGAK